MPSLKSLRNRISSVKSTRKITKAMQMVAAAKLRKAQSAAEAARPYATQMSKVLSNLAAGQKNSPSAHPLLVGNGNDKNHLLIVCTAERGLCGSFNSSIARLARDHARKLTNEGKTFTFYCVGRKGYDVLRRIFPGSVERGLDMKGISRLGYEHAEEVGEYIVNAFSEGKYDVCTLFYSQFVSVISQKPTMTALIPAQIEEKEAKENEETKSVSYEYEPDEEELLADLLPRNVSVQVFRALLENAASEQGSRMTAMDNATRNAGDMIDRLTLNYNKARQAMITKELIEIISGAEAL